MIVQIWWDGNSAFYEAEVQEYDAQQELYKCFYINDGEVSHEPLADPARSDWFWLDESSEDSKIRKKVSQLFYCFNCV